MENLSMIYVHFNELALSSIRTHTWEFQDTKILKEAFKSKQIEMGSQIRRQGHPLSAVLFETFPYFQGFRI